MLHLTFQRYVAVECPLNIHWQLPYIAALSNLSGGSSAAFLIQTDRSRQKVLSEPYALLPNDTMHTMKRPPNN